MAMWSNLGVVWNVTILKATVRADFTVVAHPYIVENYASLYLGICTNGRVSHDFYTWMQGYVLSNGGRWCNLNGEWIYHADTSIH